jgi:hypothetical protein
MMEGEWVVWEWFTLFPIQFAFHGKKVFIKLIFLPLAQISKLLSHNGNAAFQL